MTEDMPACESLRAPAEILCSVCQGEAYASVSDECDLLFDLFIEVRARSVAPAQRVSLLSASCRVGWRCLVRSREVAPAGAKCRAHPRNARRSDVVLWFGLGLAL